MLSERAITKDGYDLTAGSMDLRREPSAKVITDPAQLEGRELRLFEGARQPGCHLLIWRSVWQRLWDVPEASLHPLDVTSSVRGRQGKGAGSEAGAETKGLRTHRHRALTTPR